MCLHMNIQNILLISWKSNTAERISPRDAEGGKTIKKSLFFLIESETSVPYLPVPILSQPTPVHIITPCVFKINLNIIFTCMSTLYHQAFRPKFRTHFSTLPFVLCATSSSSSDLIVNKGYVWGSPNSLQSHSSNQHIQARNRNISTAIKTNTHTDFTSTYQRQCPTCHRPPQSKDAATHATTSNNTDNFYMKIF
jgi:hypothetical protein